MNICTSFDGTEETLNFKPQLWNVIEIVNFIHLNIPYDNLHLHFLNHKEVQLFKPLRADECTATKTVQVAEEN